MANRLKVAMLQALVTLWQQGWSQRQIARKLAVDRATVGRYVRQLRVLTGRTEMAAGAANAAILPTGSGDEQVPADPGQPNAAILPAGSVELSAANAAILPTGSVAGPEPPVRSAEPAGSVLPANPAILPTGSGSAPTGPGLDLETLVQLLRRGAGRKAAADAAAAPATPRSVCAPFRELIQAKLEQGLTAQRIYQDLVADHSFTHGYDSVRRFARQLTPDAAVPFRRLEVPPGTEVQVDFGRGAPLVAADGRRQHTHVFRVVLSHSRKAYSEVVTRQTTEAFLGCLENAFQHFGGVPKTVVLDNLRAAVSQADWFDPELVPKVQAFAAHYGTVFLPTRPAMPRHKGKVERGIAFVQDNALKGHTFASLVEQNRHLAHWEQTVADTRIHGTTRRQAGKMFAEVERAALLPLPAERFPDFREGERTVHRDGHVEVDKAFYSVPPEYLGRKVWVRWDRRLVRVFNQRFEQIALHAKHLSGSFSTQDAHIPTTKHNAIDRGAKALLAQARQLGPHTGAWAEAMLQDRGIAGLRVLLGLLTLAKRQAVETLEQACHAAHQHGAYRLRTVRRLLERQTTSSSQQEFTFLDSHPIIRSLAAYGQVVHASSPEPGCGGREDTSGPSFPPAPHTPHPPSFPLSVPAKTAVASAHCDMPTSLLESATPTHPPSPVVTAAASEPASPS